MQIGIDRQTETLRKISIKINYKDIILQGKCKKIKYITANYNEEQPHKKLLYNSKMDKNGKMRSQIMNECKSAQKGYKQYL